MRTLAGKLRRNEGARDRKFLRCAGIWDSSFQLPYNPKPNLLNPDWDVIVSQSLEPQLLWTIEAHVQGRFPSHLAYSVWRMQTGSPRC